MVTCISPQSSENINKEAKIDFTVCSKSKYKHNFGAFLSVYSQYITIDIDFEEYIGYF